MCLGDLQLRHSVSRSFRRKREFNKLSTAKEKTGKNARGRSRLAGRPDHQLNVGLIDGKYFYFMCSNVFSRAVKTAFFSERNCSKKYLANVALYDRKLSPKSAGISASFNMSAIFSFDPVRVPR